MFKLLCVLGAIAGGAGLAAWTWVGQRPCSLTSPWLAWKTEPPVAAAIGTLTYAMQDPVNAKSRRDIEIRWTNGQRSSYARDELLWSSEGETVPILGPMHPPAVFAVNGTDALVWNKAKGWACAPTKVAGIDSFSSFDESLAYAVAWMNREAQHTNDGGYVHYLHSVLTVLPQSLRIEPRADAPLSGAETKATVPCLHSTDRFGFGEHSAPDSATTKTLRWSPFGCYQAVRVVERRGHWAKLVLPSADLPMYDLDPGLLITWNDQPSGWAKIEDEGPVPGSRLIKWSIKQWWVP